MTIYIKKFGEVLTSRQAGREAYAAFLPTLTELTKNEDIFIDFEGVQAFSPSWGDEFLTPFIEKFPKHLYIKKEKNPSVILTLQMLEQVHAPYTFSFV